MQELSKNYARKIRYEQGKKENKNKKADKSKNFKGI
jgi:hypothetical protein